MSAGIPKASRGYEIYKTSIILIDLNCSHEEASASQIRDVTVNHWTDY